jgi:hypothetical protein
MLNAITQQGKTEVSLSPLRYVWWSIRTLMTQDIGYVLSHRPKGSGKTSHSRMFAALSKLGQACLSYPPLQYVWWSIRTLMTQDIGYVLSHRSGASGNAPSHLTGNPFETL